MRTIYSTPQIIRWLCELDCPSTAETLKQKAKSAEFVDSSILRSILIDDLYDRLCDTFPGHTCATKSFLSIH